MLLSQVATRGEYFLTRWMHLKNPTMALFIVIIVIRELEAAVSFD